MVAARPQPPQIRFCSVVVFSAPFISPAQQQRPRPSRAERDALRNSPSREWGGAGTDGGRDAAVEANPPDSRNRHSHNFAFCMHEDLSSARSWLSLELGSAVLPNACCVRGLEQPARHGEEGASGSCREGAGRRRRRRAKRAGLLQGAEILVSAAVRSEVLCSSRCSCVAAGDLDKGDH